MIPFTFITEVHPGYFAVCLWIRHLFQAVAIPPLFCSVQSVIIVFRHLSAKKDLLSKQERIGQAFRFLSKRLQVREKNVPNSGLRENKLFASLTRLNT